MKAFKNMITLLFFLIKMLSTLKLKVVPKALNLANHFGSDPKKNLYGPNHYINKDSFLFN